MARKKTGPKPRPVIDRFWAEVSPEPNTGCWLWLGRVSRGGYGELRVGSRTDNNRTAAYAHRLSYSMFKGDIPQGMLVCHSCDVRLCVNPEHLFVGTQTDNMRDASQKGRVKGPPQKDICPRGHSYTVAPGGYKTCLPCRREIGRRHYYRSRGRAYP
jgi:hypothetical protein